MIKFERYSHIGDLFSFYAEREKRSDILSMLAEGINNEEQAEKFCSFAWDIAGFINEDHEENRTVLESTDNTDMIPDLSYELTKLMKSIGYYHVWKVVSDREML